jgi:hypothetical protein
MKQSEELDIFQLWKKYDINRVLCNFTCGGDSMGDMDWEVVDEKDKTLKFSEVSEITDYFDGEIFNKVDFYEVSDGNYMGEYGTVTITLNEEGDGFDYHKESYSEFNEQYSDIMDVTLSDREVELVKEYVKNINGGDGDIILNYKKDGILSEEDDEILDSLKERIKDEAYDLDIEEADGEWDESCNFTTDINENDGDVVIEGNTLKVRVNKNYNVEREG